MLSQRVVGLVDDTRTTCDVGWQEFLERHVNPFVEQGRHDRSASSAS